MSKKMMILLFAVIICLSLAGCSLQDNIGNNGFTKIFMKFMVQINDRYYIAKRQCPIFVFLPLWVMIY